MSAAPHPSQVLCRLLGVRYPVLQGGMTFGSDGRLTAAVSASGGLGTLGTFHYRTHEEIAAQLRLIREATDRPFSVNVPFFHNSFALVERLAREEGVKMFTLGGWCSPEMVALKQELGLTVLVSVNSPTVARMVLERPFDVLIVQGNESGGANNDYTTRQLFDLISPDAGGRPVLLAGGQWDGADLHQALLIGAGGIQLGTRFFFSEESPLHPTIKAQLLDHNKKRPLTTTLTPVSDTLNMRFVGNKAYRTALKADELKVIFQDKEKVFAVSEAFTRPADKPLLVYAGTGLYKLRAIEPAGQVVAGIMAGYQALAGVTLPSFA